MDQFEINKIMASILIALIVGMGASLLSEHIIKPEKLAKNVFIIDVPNEGQDSSTPDVSQSHTVEPIDALLGKASIENGEKIAKRCLQCHSLDKGGAHKIGPALWGVVEQPMAHHKDYPYSKAMQEKKGIWDTKTLNEFLYKPGVMVKGTKMSFTGLSKPEERADLIVYLSTLK